MSDPREIDSRRHLRDPGAHAEWLQAVREGATDDDYPLVINARVDVFLWPFLAGAEPGSQADLVPEALGRAKAYFDAGIDCVYPIALWEEDALRAFLPQVDSPVNVVRLPTGTPPLAELAALGVARVSGGPFLFRSAMARFDEELAALQG
jgi:2-methylisocitrate lyase-like PEP mutase family enzyme